MVGNDFSLQTGVQIISTAPGQIQLVGNDFSITAGVSGQGDIAVVVSLPGTISAAITLQEYMSVALALPGTISVYVEVDT